MRDGIIYDCPHADCRTPIDTGKCRKECIERYNKEMGIKPKTNADRIRAMSYELLATQLVQVVIETVKILTDLEMPDDLANEIRANFLKKLQKPAEGE